MGSRPPIRTSQRTPMAPPLVPRWMRTLLLLVACAAVMVPTFGWLAARSRIEPPTDDRPPPEPRLFDMVPADLMTKREGMTIAPGPYCLDGDHALREGEVERAAAAYAAALRSDHRDRYAALLIACLAIERGDWTAVEAALRSASEPTPPLHSPLRSVRVLAELAKAHVDHPDEPLAELYLRAELAAGREDLRAALLGRDPLRELYRDRLYGAEPRFEAAGDSDVALVIGAASQPELEARARTAFDGPRQGIDHGRDHFALIALAERGREAATPLLDEALRRASANEPHNSYWEWIRAALHSPMALASDRPDGAAHPSLGTDDEPDLLPGFAPESLTALADATARRECDAHVAELLHFEVATRRAAGERFAAARPRSPRDSLYLGYPRLAKRLAYRALVVDRSLSLPTAHTLVAAAVALSLFDARLAADPRLAPAGEDGDERALARSLLEGARALGLEIEPLARRIATFAPMRPLPAAHAAAFNDVLVPLPIPRLVDELFERYAADLPALANALQRASTRGG